MPPAFRWKIGLGGLFIIALAIRLWRIDYHSLWFDEAMSVFWARRPALDILDIGLRLVRDKHPPMYYLLLHYWIALWGDGPLSVRMPSVLFGALLPPTLAALGKEWFDRRVGLIAGLLAALNPILVWYSQEARMFMPATTLGVVSTWTLTRALKENKWIQWTGFVLLSIAGFYSYLFYAFMLAFHGVYAFGRLFGPLVRKDRRSFRLIVSIMIAFGLVGLMCTPLAWQAFRVSGAESAPGRPFDQAGHVLWHLLLAYTVREVPWPPWLQSVVVLLAVILTISGMALSVARRRPAPLLWLLLPLLVGNALLAFDHTVFGEDRYMLFLVPALCLCWAHALTWASQRTPQMGILALGLWLVLAFAALPSIWSPEYRRENWRAAAAYISSRAGPHDAILIHPAFVRPAFEYYYQGQAPVFALFEGHIDSPEHIDGPLTGLAHFSALWLVTSHDAEPDPQGLVRKWFEERFPMITEQYPAGIAVRGYATHYRLTGMPAGAVQANVNYRDGLQLVGYAIDQTDLSPTDNVYHPPSNWIHVTLYWSARRPLSHTLHIQLRMVDGQGRVWGERLERPNETLNRLPTTDWTVGELIRTDFDVNLNPATPAGEYRLELTVFDDEGKPWTLEQSADQHLELTRIRIRR